MPGLIGNQRVSRFYLGDALVSRIYLGGSLVWYPSVVMTPGRFEVNVVDQNFVFPIRLSTVEFEITTADIKLPIVLESAQFEVITTDVAFVESIEMEPAEFTVTGQDLPFIAFTDPWEVIHYFSTPSGSNYFEVTGLDLSPYAVVEIMLNGVKVASDSADLRIEFYIDGVAPPSGYKFGVNSISSSGTISNVGDEAENFLVPHNPASAWGVGNAADESYSGRFTVYNTNMSLYKLMDYYAEYVAPSGRVVTADGHGFLNQTGDITGIAIFDSSVNITSGQILIRGLRI